MVPPASHRVPRVRWYSGSCLVNILFAYRTITYYGVSSHTLLLKILNQLRSPQPQRYCYLWFGLFPFRSPLLRKSMFLSFPPPTKMFQFRGLAHFRVTGLLPAGLSHSEILGSILVCKSPRLIAAYHVFHRLLTPRHPPDALVNLYSKLLPSIPIQL